MKPRILLLGSGGQIGRGLAQFLPDLGELLAFDRRQLDLTRPEEIRQTIRSMRPNLIVNAAAYTNVDRAESEEAIARTVNTDAPGVMAEEARNAGAAVVHYSTDYVFDGTKRTPYGEDDPPNPQNAYGRTKLAGEQAIRQSGAPHLIFRTAWVYDREGRNFLRTILRLAAQHEELRIVHDQIGAPTWSREIAQATVQVLRRMNARNDFTESFDERGGTYHMTASGETSWWGFAKAIVDQASHHPPGGAWFVTATGDCPLITQRVIPIAADQYPTPACRPTYSVLSNARLSRAFGVHLADWRTQLRNVFSDDAPERSATG
jgi:dTDP-4-dehydrorhamnose reductase